MTSHYLTLLLDLPFILKTCKPVTDQGFEETQTQPSQEETSLIAETIGSNISQRPLYTTLCCEILCMHYYVLRYLRLEDNNRAES